MQITTKNMYLLIEHGIISSSNSLKIVRRPLKYLQTTITNMYLLIEKMPIVFILLYPLDIDIMEICYQDVKMSLRCVIFKG